MCELTGTLLMTEFSGHVDKRLSCPLGFLRDVLCFTHLCAPVM